MGIRPGRPVYLTSWGTVVGKKEKDGPLGTLFDYADTTDLFGMDTFEKAESEMQKQAAGLALTKGGYTPEQIELLMAGDLVNQCIASTYGLLSYSIPYLGLFGACSTAAEGLLLAALFTGAYGKRCLTVTSSHFCTAERQFRYPLEYGGQRPPTSQWTVTGAGAFVCSAAIEDVIQQDGFVSQIREVLPGRIVDGGITDAANMGAAMAPAAADTILRYYAEHPDLVETDMLLTGDLGKEGSAILAELLWNGGIDIEGKMADCGKMIYPMDERADVHAGGSGCGCSAVVLAADILENLRHGVLHRVVFVGTGALMNPMALFQGQSIPGIAHLVEIEAVEIPDRTNDETFMESLVFETKEGE